LKDHLYEKAGEYKEKGRDFAEKLTADEYEDDWREVLDNFKEKAHQDTEFREHKSASELSGFYFYNRANQLLQHVTPHFFSSPEDILKITKIRNLAIDLLRTLAIEEAKLKNLIERRDALKTGFWVLDNFRRDQVAELQTEIYSQHAVVYHVYDSIEAVINTAKPIVGPFSWLLVRDLFVFYFHLVDFVVNALSFMLTLSLVELLVYGPLLGVGLWGLSQLLSYFYIYLPIAAGVSILLRIVNMPFIIIKYNPNFFEFLFIFMGGLGVGASLLFLMKRIYDGIPIVEFESIPKREPVEYRIKVE